MSTTQEPSRAVPCPARIEPLLRWGAAADEALRAAGDPASEAAWPAWRLRLLQRLADRKALGDSPAQLVLGLAESWARDSRVAATWRDSVALWERFAAGRAAPIERIRKAVLAWLDDVEDEPCAPLVAWQAVCAAHALPRLAEQFDRGLWLQLVLRLCDLAREFAPGDNPLVNQWLTVELPWRLARNVPELACCASAADFVQQTTLAADERTYAPSGWLRAQHAPHARGLLASALRVLSLAGGGASASDVLDRRLSQLALLVCAARRSDGRSAFTWPPIKPAAPSRSWWQAAERLADRARPAPQAAAASRDLSAQSSASRAWHAEQASYAWLAPREMPTRGEIALRYWGDECELELSAAGKLLLAGPWLARVSADGQPLCPRGAWEEVCFNTDEEGDYVELSLPLEGGWQLQRQLLLSRRGAWAWLADLLVPTEVDPSPERFNLAYDGRLLLAHGATFAPAQETTEGWLQTPQRRALCVPAALPEWRSQARDAGLAVQGAGLHLRQAAPRARALYAPLFLDFSTARLRRSCTWRQLSVAERRDNVPRDVAAGFRVQSGKQQWVFYRALTHCGNRTILGKNLCSEFLAGEFLPSGAIETILEITGD